jgi:thiol:disulfide interchange protein/DsbC/DsbD-like thiol-disulfide interchange protein
MKTRLKGLVLIGLLCALPARAANPVATENVTARLVTEHNPVAPGGTADLALVLDIRPGWHTYWENPGDSGEPPHIVWHLLPGLSAGPIRWPHPDLIRVGPLASYGYTGRATHLVSLRIPQDWPAGRPLKLTADASWLVCADHCVPESAALELTIQTAAHAGPPDPAVEGIFAAARARLPRPFAGKARISPSGEGLRLELDAHGLPAGVSSVWFFARHWGLIGHAAAEPWHLDGGRLEVHLTPGDLGQHASPEGVLVVASGAGTAAFAVSPSWASLPAQTAAVPLRPLGLPLALAFALLGGLILNLMPCVFPVLALKALSLTTQGSGERPAARVWSGVAYTAGVLCFFALVAALLLALRAAGKDLGWGYQLQYPPFVALMAYLFLSLGLSLTGAVTLGARLMGLGAARPRAGLGGAFAAGGLAALVAAPCTAPFMGAALGYAMTVAPPLALAIMLTVGLGLALPYLMLALIPRAGRLLPRPGPWMETLKQLLAFPMFATAAWLVWVLSVQAGPSGVAAVLSGGLLVALGLWLWERSRRGSTGQRRLGGAGAVATLAAALVLGAGITPVAPKPYAAPVPKTAKQSPLQSQPFTLQALRAARAAGRPVFVNMTAAWCITCLVNERVALSSPAVARAFGRKGVLYLKGDWTNRDPMITDYLAGFRRNGVPIYVYYPPGQAPEVLPQILTTSMVLDVLKAGTRSGKS